MPKKSDVPIWSLSTNSLKIFSGFGSYKLAPTYTASSVYIIFTSVLNSSGIGVPFFGSSETKSVAISAFFHESSFNLASITMVSFVFFADILFLV